MMMKLIVLWELKNAHYKTSATNLGALRNNSARTSDGLIFTLNELLIAFSDRVMATMEDTYM